LQIITHMLSPIILVIVKNLLKSALNLLHLDLTKNLEYDRYTKQIMKKVIGKNSNCIDVGCHKGELLNVIVRLAPGGTHFGFEPIPELYNQLITKYKNKARLYPYALSDTNGVSNFQFVRNAPAYSGIKKRLYTTNNPDIDEISVATRTLDGIIPDDINIDFIKIDVEGGEFDVLKGGIMVLKRCQPIVIFESGLGASDYYGTEPEDLYDFLTCQVGLNISLLKSYIKDGNPLRFKDFLEYYHSGKEYYFIAHR
jgi:FkbM family methyltransferase